MSDIDQILAEVSRLEPVTWHARSALTENSYTTTVISPDSTEDDGINKANVLPSARLVASYLSGKDAEDIVLCRAAAPVLAAEVERLRLIIASIQQEIGHWLLFPSDPETEARHEQAHEALTAWESAEDAEEAPDALTMVRGVIFRVSAG